MKIKITRPDGTVVEAEGTAEECERVEGACYIPWYAISGGEFCDLAAGVCKRCGVSNPTPSPVRPRCQGAPLGSFTATTSTVLRTRAEIEGEILAGMASRTEVTS